MDINNNRQPFDFGRTMRLFRQEKGYTLEKAQQMTGVAKSTLSKIENNQISPSFETLQAIAIGLKIELPQLFERLMDKPKPFARLDITRAPRPVEVQGADAVVSSVADSAGASSSSDSTGVTSSGISSAANDDQAMAMGGYKQTVNSDLNGFGDLAEQAKGASDVPNGAPAKKGRKQNSGEVQVDRRALVKQQPNQSPDRLLAQQISNKKLIPTVLKITNRSVREFTEEVKDRGDAFLYVLKGSIILFSEFYEPIELHKGDSIYYDCSMGQNLLSSGDEDAEVLWVTA